MAFEVFDDVAFYWFLLAVLVMFIVPMSSSFYKVCKAGLTQKQDWTRGMKSCEAKLAVCDARRNRETRKKVFGWRGIGFTVGWTGLIILATSFATMQVPHTGLD